MKKILLASLALMVMLSASAQGFKTRKDSVSYALGVTMAETIKKSEIVEYDENIIKKAMSETLSGKANLDATISEKILKEEKRKIAEQKSIEVKKAGDAFLAENKKKKGVQTTASGLQYMHTQEGTGAKPDANDKVTVHYHGTLIDGTVFDSSVQKGTPVPLTLNAVIPGWTEGLQLMKEGGKTTFYIPSELAYGPRNKPKIPANSALIFEVELIKVEPVEGTTAAPAAPPVAAPSKK